ncbi:MAG TPA: efflux RND transporter periplasmic adaptor subunit [Bryobacteraceae bacterium]|nr:efflux RND transporter periplasmic adaptor subunit [Bryobacteraceae bacterium]
MTVGLRSFLLIAPALFLCGCKQDQKGAAGAAGGFPMMPVTVAKATQESVPAELRAVGTVEASAIVQVKSQVAGQLASVAFTEGQDVKEGDLLFRIDPQPFQDALRQAQADAARDQAQIAQSQATLARDQAQAQYAETDASRNDQLVKEGLASRSQYDQSKSNADVARETVRATQAGIDSAKATLQADEAAIAAAQLNLSYCELRAPISGRTGNLLVHPGNLVKVNDAALVVIHRIEPIFVNFSIPEQRLEEIRRLSAGHKLAVKALVEGNPGHPAEGYLSVIDNTVDASTGTIHLKATFDNHDRMLWPGQFVTVALTLETVQNATVIPSEAIQAGQNGLFVYVVKANQTVESRVVATGAALNGKTVIEKGVSPGETVVTDGMMMLVPGAPVRAVPAAKAGSGPS